MELQIYWENYTRSHISPAEFGKGMSFKNKLGAKPAILHRVIEITLPNKVNLHWKRELERAISKQFQRDKKATIYFSGFKGDETSAFVLSARSPVDFSNRVANGILEIRGSLKGLGTIDHAIDNHRAVVRKISH